MEIPANIPDQSVDDSSLDLDSHSVAVVPAGVEHSQMLLAVVDTEIFPSTESADNLLASEVVEVHQEYHALTPCISDLHHPRLKEVHSRYYWKEQSPACS